MMQHKLVKFSNLGLLGLLLLFSMFEAKAAVPLIINYQGNVTNQTDGTPINVTSYFKFALLNRAKSVVYWVNNGAVPTLAEPSLPVTVTVSEGVFSVKLGDPLTSNMNLLDQTIFDNEELFLRVWFSTDSSALSFDQFQNDIQILSTGFAIRAGKADSIADLSVTSASIVDDTVTDADISPSAAINFAKINSNGAIGNVDIAADASIAFSKIAATGSIDDTHIASGVIGDAHIASDAAIAFSKILSSGRIVNADISAATKIDLNKLNLTGFDAQSLGGSSATDFVRKTDNYAGSSSSAGTATNALNVTCVGCVGTTKIADGSVTAAKIAPGSLDVTQMAPSIISIPASAFRSATAMPCLANQGPGDFFYFTGGDNCWAIAPLYLPHGVNVDKLTCYVTDADSGMQISEIDLYYRTMTSATATAMLDLAGTTNSFANTAVQEIASTGPIPGSIVNNSTRVYFIRIKMRTSTQGSPLAPLMSINGCKVEYS